jgi:hypothetical protein
MTTDDLRLGDLITIQLKEFLAQYRVLFIVRFHSAAFGSWYWIQTKQWGRWSFDWFFTPRKPLARFEQIANVQNSRGKRIYTREIVEKGAEA